jgi:hypothetical protein
MTDNTERKTMDKEGLRHDIERAINANSAEAGSNTPDFILAEYLVDCIAAFDKSSTRREQWYGVKQSPGQKRGEVAVFFQDGNQQCAVRPDFINLQESLAGFGDTNAKALEALEASEREDR